MHAKSITFEVFCKSSMAVKSVGVARIVVADFFRREFARELFAVPESWVEG